MSTPRPSGVIRSFAILLALSVILGNVRLPAAAPLPFDHISFSVPDIEKAVAWYTRQFQAAADDGTGVVIDRVRFRFRKAATAAPSAGSVIDHIAFSVPSIAAWQASSGQPGAAKPPAGGVPGSVFVEDPWGTRLELIEGDRRGLHHVHLHSRDANAAATWMVDTLGGTRTRRDTLSGVSFGDALIAIDQSAQAPAGSDGHVVDHLGWTTPNLADTAAPLKRAGIRFFIEPRTVNGLTMAFIAGPEELRVELLQR